MRLQSWDLRGRWWGEKPGGGLTALSVGKPREAYAVAKVPEGLPSARSHLPGSCQAGACAVGCLSPTPPMAVCRGAQLDSKGIETRVTSADLPHIGDLPGIAPESRRQTVGLVEVLVISESPPGSAWLILKQGMPLKKKK